MWTVGTEGDSGSRGGQWGTEDCGEASSLEAPLGAGWTGAIHEGWGQRSEWWRHDWAWTAERPQDAPTQRSHGLKGLHPVLPRTCQHTPLPPGPLGVAVYQDLWVVMGLRPGCRPRGGHGGWVGTVTQR